MKNEILNRSIILVKDSEQQNNSGKRELGVNVTKM